MRPPLHFQPRHSIPLRQIVSWWPYLLIGISITGLAYRYWQVLR